MLLYRSIVISALDDEVEPLLRSLVNQALTCIKGQNWYSDYGRSIMNAYSDFDKIEGKIQQGIAPINALDMTALFFLLNPYAKDSTGNTSSFTGAMDTVADYYHWNSWQCNKLNRIRLIRNGATHDNCDNNYTPTEEELRTGMQEKKWLNEIEAIIKNLQPSFQLTDYKTRLAEQIRKHSGAAKESPLDANTAQVEAIRSDIQKIYRFDFCQAPIGAPLSGPAPWASCDADLDELPWPQLDAAIPPQRSSAGNNESGVSKFFNWLSKKL